jgi:A/G-specific adenine glycosylase
MLQQTTVAAVIPYFQRWMAKFPTLDSLASAPEEDALSAWQGLGYYSRARNLRWTAQMIIKQAGGKLPTSAQALRCLPGVGDYTAAAIACFAFDAPEPVVDSNVARVLTRLRNWRKPLDNARARAFLKAAAHKLLPKKDCRLHNSALMELGALVCVAKKPRCHQCPLRSHCLAEEPHHLPVLPPRRSIEEIVECRAFVLEQGKLWLEPSAGPRWRGLWLLPEAKPARGQADYVQKYSVTRFRVTMKVHVRGRESLRLRGFCPDALPPMPSPHRRAVAAMLARVHTPA